ncbi:hypothetical protein AB8R67_13635 [Klebsiella pneumoniae]|uniref:hypothetical protein n=1 Tax=Klebsiella pneumoniae TaxID=573 RepID=UPI00049F2B72|nr:hypothetical protein [Klebsiella pneumoniae]HEO9371096.1 hypothetical protein [Klebsiella pneumoniae subsp. pneumoniae]EKU8499746.1 hypothetical protein [Klebsiella pneumoniae]EKZ5279539.1 hypothetical protein [Klebsiella pneumoniae]ELA0688310.1 hypothetical protein [Klebsiella pneumoniae]ELA2343801.1 hypothetical protein [Klebsiella pneumoniae]
MKAVDLIKKMELYVHSALYACELSIAAGSAMSFSKEKWNVGPSLHSAANRPQLNNKILPLTLKTSDIFQLALHVMNDLKIPQKEKNGGRRMFNINDLTPPDEIMSAQTILYLFCLLEEYEFLTYENALTSNLSRVCHSDQYTLKNIEELGVEGVKKKSIERHMATYQFSACRKRIKYWGKMGLKELPEGKITLYEQISKRRNELTHLSTPTPASRFEAVNFYLVCRNLVRDIAISFADESINELDIEWDIWSELEHDVQNDSLVHDLAKVINNNQNHS